LEEALVALATLAQTPVFSENGRATRAWLAAGLPPAVQCAWHPPTAAERAARAEAEEPPPALAGGEVPQRRCRL